MAVDLAVMLADGGETITDLAVLRDQREVFGPVAATPTAWRLLADIGPPALAALREARATARDIAWLQAVDTRDGIPASRAGGRDLPCLVLDLDAPLVTSHSEKEQGAAAYKRGFGYRPLLCFLHHIRALPDRVWHPALEQDGSLRDGAEAAELTGMIDLTGYPDGTRVIVRRERPHPCARLSLFDFDEGMRTWPFSPTPRSRVGEPRNAWRPATARMPAWRSASACSSGPRPCCWTASRPPPSRRSSATGCCAPPPASPAEAADSASGSPLPGVGDTS